MRPDVAAAFDLMAAAARREAGLYLSVSSGFRSDAEQAVLWNAKPNPRLFSALRRGESAARAGRRVGERSSLHAGGKRSATGA